MEQTLKIKHDQIPSYVTRVTETLEKAGFEAYIVGGCVRDLILGRVPKDWDITTNAVPDEIIPLFEKTVYENKFGTVAVVFESYLENQTKSTNLVSRETLSEVVTHETNELKTYIVEVTPYRTETQYSDFRHPDKVEFSNKIEDDLMRRDFTINAMAYSISHETLVDLYNGQSDLKDMSLRTVGEADDRFNEDALRMLRAVRFAVQLGFSISHETAVSLQNKANLIEKVSCERIRDEFEKIILSPEPAVGIGMLQKFGLL